MDNEVAAMRTLMRYSPKVLENTIIVHEPEVLYHISPNDSVKEFIPRPVKRAMPGEDNTVARVCTAPTILDCIRGYAVTVDDFLKDKAGCAGGEEWRGGYYIYAIPTELNIKITEKLAPIAKWCDERWLIDYKQKGQKYPAKVIGQMFYKSARGDQFAEVEIYVRLDDDIEGLVPFSDRLSLGKGCHAVTVADLDAYYRKGSSTRVMRDRRITLAEYLKAKGVKADMLSYEPPAFLGWE